MPTIAFFTSRFVFFVFSFQFLIIFSNSFRDVFFMEELCWDYNSDEMLNKFHCTCGHVFCKGIPKGISLAQSSEPPPEENPLLEVDTEDELADYDDSPGLKQTRLEIIKLIMLFKERLFLRHGSLKASPYRTFNEEVMLRKIGSNYTISELISKLTRVEAQYHDKRSDVITKDRLVWKAPEIRIGLFQAYKNKTHTITVDTRLCFIHHWRTLVRYFEPNFPIRAKDFVVFDVIVFYRTRLSKRPKMSFLSNIREEVFHYVFSNLYNATYLAHYLTFSSDNPSMFLEIFADPFKDKYIGSTFEEIFSTKTDTASKLKTLFTRLTDRIRSGSIHISHRTFEKNKIEYKEKLIERALKSSSVR